MEKTILVAGATGNLGNRICRELLKRNAAVKALVRHSADPDKIAVLEKMGVQIYPVEMNDINEITRVCEGVSCVISAVAGLKEVIIDFQKILLDAAILAGVPRFIPSDFCTDYNDLTEGENRNFDWRREFKKYTDQSSVRASSVFNGCFADILQYNMPILNLKEKSIGYWGDQPDWRLDFTTMDNTAEFTAEVALDDTAARNLQIASFQVSPLMIFEDVKKIMDREFKIHQISSLDEFAESIRKQRTENPASEHELYAKFQQGQYMYSMFTTHHMELSNNRYQGITWTKSSDFLKTFL